VIRGVVGTSFLVGVLLLAGCGGSDGDGGSVLRSPDPTGTQAQDAELVQGREIYEESCVACHGVEGDGGVGPQLSEGVTVGKYPELDAEVEIVTDGLNQMPAFEGTLSADEIRDVTRYTREVL